MNYYLLSFVSLVVLSELHIGVYAAKPKCGQIPKVDAGCKLTTGPKDPSGCPSWTIDCVSIDPPFIAQLPDKPKRLTRAAKILCPAIGIPKTPAGCTLTTGKDVNGCPTWTIGCNSPNPPHHLVKRSATEGFVCGSNVCNKKQRCQAGKCLPCPLVLPQEPKPGCHLERTQEAGQCAKIIQRCPNDKRECPAVGVPKPEEGCTLESTDDNGCPVWVMRCPRGKRALTDGFVCGSNVCSKKERCESGQCFPCPEVFPPEPKLGCHLERIQEPGHCSKIFQRCPDDKPKRTTRAAEEEKPKVQKPKCPKNAEYRECTNICPDKSCDNYLTPSPCFSLRCGPPSCMCKEGHVLLDQENKDRGCVERETCRKLAQLADAKKKIGSN